MTELTPEPGRGLGEDELPSYAEALHAFHAAAAPELSALYASLPLSPRTRVLDVACGDGCHGMGMAEHAGQVIGLDRSFACLRAARARGLAALVQADAAALPFADGSFDLVSMGYALRHMADLALAFGELGRVLAPGGTLLVLELTPPRHRPGRALLRVYLGRVLPLVSLLTTGSHDARTLMRYHWDTVEACVPPETILAAMRGADLTHSRCDVQFGFLRAYVGRKTQRRRRDSDQVPRADDGAMPDGDHGHQKQGR